MQKNHTPLLIPLLFFIIGIVIPSLVTLHTYLILCLLGSCVILFYSTTKGVIKSISIQLAFLFLGFIIAQVTEEQLLSKHFANQRSDYLHIEVMKAKSTQNGYSYTVKVKGYELRGQLIRSSGKMLIYTDTSFVLGQYCSYVIPGNFDSIDRFNNPGRFDYGTYLSHQNIFHKTYLKRSPIKTKDPGLFKGLVRDMRLHIQQYFSSTFANEQVSNLVNAIFLGKKEGMAKDVRVLFTNNGLAHLLAISGMHVGIILLILNFTFTMISVPWLKKLLVVSGVWLYIIVSGMQTPAIRAGFMLTIFIVGQIHGRNIKGLNSIFFAAMMMLALEPKLIYQVSFQLSFAAMSSILIFYKPIFTLFHFTKLWQVKLWQLVALNLSVQVFILPITVYYFKQIPTYFLITSIVSIPFVLIIMWGAIISLLCGLLLNYGRFINELLENIIEFYISLLSSFARLPFALYTQLEIHVLHLITWFIAALAFKFFVMKRTRNYTYACCAFLPLLIVSSVLRISKNSQAHMFIYDDPQEVVMDYNDGNRLVRFQSNIDYQPYLLKDTPASEVVPLNYNEVIRLRGKTIALVKSGFSSPINQVDICIQSEQDTSQSYLQSCKTVILPRSLNLNNHGTDLYNIKLKGAYQINFN